MSYMWMEGILDVGAHSVRGLDQQRVRFCVLQEWVCLQLRYDGVKLRQPLPTFGDDDVLCAARMLLDELRLTTEGNRK